MIAPLPGLARLPLEAGALLALATAALALLFRARLAGRLAFSWAQLRAVSHSLVVAALLLPVLMAALPRESLMRPSVQVWSEASGKERLMGFVFPREPARVGSPSKASRFGGVALREKWASLALAIYALGCMAGLSVLAGRFRRLRGLLGDAFRIRKLGSVRIVAAEWASTPFSAPSSAPAGSPIPGPLSPPTPRRAISAAPWP